MAEGENTDLFMKFEITAKNYVLGEHGTVLLGPNTSGLNTDFGRGNVIAINKFTMSTGIIGDDQESDPVKDLSAKTDKMFDKISKEMGKDFGKLAGNKSGFTRFLKAYQGVNTRPFPVDMKPFQVTRKVDRASSQLFKCFVTRKVMTSASLIKRKPAGGTVSGQTFLRFDFTKVLLINYSWDDGEQVTETLEFVCRKVRIQYLPQLPSGELGAAMPAEWSASGTTSSR